MKRPVRALLLFVAVLSAMAFAAQAETTEACQPEENVIECIQRRFNQDTEAAAAAKKIEKTPSADQSPGAATTLRDVLPVFFTSLGLGTVSEENETLTLTFNPDRLRSEAAQWTLQARVYEPEPLDKLVMEAAEADRETVKGQISDGLGDFDDVEIEVSWTRQTERSGRDFRFHSSTAERFLNELSEPFDLPDKEEARQKLVNKIGDELAAHQGTKFSDLPPGIAVEFEQLISEAQEELEGVRKGLKKELVGKSYFRLADLVNNQPQWSASLTFRERDDLVGQDSIKGNVTYEWSQVNVNRFKKWCKEQEKEDTASAACLAAYWKKKGARTEYLPRFKLAFDYESLDDLDISFTPTAGEEADESGISAEPQVTTPEPLTLMLDGTEKLVGTAGFGRYLRLDDDGNQISRFDIEVKYEWVEDDSTRNKRYVASATYSQRVSDGASASLGFIYASDPEFRGEVEKEFSARAGLKFKLDRKEKE